ncbi:polysaccharide pyruvyl transferase WcaK-like protein [Dyadobacter sp. BE34]|uniref:Polysaccharide pyruvyl transferase WcaK-like protein n=1 Tax=Dyadobacter fermentans TaxID=94254 RepID=A0ABU1R780_9BACT|nr:MULTISPECIES: polysaccharide pyruvyl transferase family protein [Dyadobacter]MDR6809228.1 polysaccharide pyruvyl transferase WcaK-like protein [Dyadobacter fermentans]MDR7046971.1 polysaccharide pyruvyl transferase WcaK-like protein [Dyadobacter sp. BE242]MDR7201285.1 polysaccharide pyruvyl transferase WcaK-like protein [Dyadobacter sp. BE34]MDR7219245.1 polysaccharide pyruvyl transferase WcaK-like protein [Dyadobacter sp. BE31]MDR7264545.1 polysaccharide pyruvyl transferase WcaK-like prote
MQQVKTFLKILPDNLLWSGTKFLAKFKKRTDNNAILLIPAGDLDGGFGEDIMITSFIKNFSNDRPVTVLTYNVIHRPDYLDKFGNVSYAGGFRDLNYLKLFGLMREHSEVLVIGADIMDGTYGLFASLLRLRMLRLANILGLTAKVSGFSVSKNILPRVKEEFMLASQTTKIKARDIDSFQRLASFLPESRLVLTNDIAFICPTIPVTYEGKEFEAYQSWCDSEKQKNKKIIGICPNSIQAKKIGLDRYVADLTLLIDNFLSVQDFSLIFLYHDTRPLCGNDTDKTISERLFKHFKSKNVSCYLPDEIKNGVSLKGYLNSIDFTVTGRMHLGISGIVARKPMYGICYANKFEGMLKLFDIDPSICLVDYTDMKNSSSTIKSFLDEQDKLIAQIDKKLPEVQFNTQSNNW